jgi:ABC-type Fe2+-enterobactin transport system substrate-binding protein
LTDVEFRDYSYTKLCQWRKQITGERAMADSTINKFDDKLAKTVALIAFVGVFLLAYMFV